MLVLLLVLLLARLLMRLLMLLLTMKWIYQMGRLLLLLSSRSLFSSKREAYLLRMTLTARHVAGGPMPLWREPGDVNSPRCA